MKRGSVFSSGPSAKRMVLLTTAVRASTAALIGPWASLRSRRFMSRTGMLALNSSNARWKSPRLRSVGLTGPPAGAAPARRVSAGLSSRVEMRATISVVHSYPEAPTAPKQYMGPSRVSGSLSSLRTTRRTSWSMARCTRSANTNARVPGAQKSRRVGSPLVCSKQMRSPWSAETTSAASLLNVMCSMMRLSLTPVSTTLPSGRPRSTSARVEGTSRSGSGRWSSTFMIEVTRQGYTVHWKRSRDATTEVVDGAVDVSALDVNTGPWADVGSSLAPLPSAPGPGPNTEPRCGIREVSMRSSFEYASWYVFFSSLMSPRLSALVRIHDPPDSKCIVSTSACAPWSLCWLIFARSARL
eukprot:comp24225_c0_seq1/m.59985 comp24225_c0_seq1/g.59985  ORF comp24225_c0_seq1/g.59985 comp24225_c0_seq1/m.59985 type:complete len:356 (-) comp24225_c0_seq1:449-1516(-)